MSKKGIQRKKLPADGELTINDFANAKCPRDKCRKSVTKKLIKHQVLLPSDENNYENDCLNEELSDSQKKLNCKQRKKLKKMMEKEDPNHIYNDYHIDVWFLISEYIQPENVGRFALICKKTDAVVSSAKFWYNLYRKYYKPSLRNNLPQKLQPDCMVRLGELRARVICSLFYMYLPFVKRLKLPSNLNILKQLECSCAWHKQEDKIWIFCYRFTNRIQTRKSPRQEFIRMNKNLNNSNNDKISKCNDDFDDNFDEFLLQFNNIFDNPSEGHHLLVIFTKRFIPFPKFHGQKVFLNSARQPISNDLRNFNLEIKFCNYRNENIATVTYDNVIKFRILSWWHPDYNIFSNL